MKGINFYTCVWGLTSTIENKEYICNLFKFITNTNNEIIPLDIICLNLIISSDEVNIYIYQEWYPLKRYYKETHKVSRVGTSRKSARQGSRPSYPVPVPAEGGGGFRDSFGNLEIIFFKL